MFSNALPIDSLLPEIIRALRQSPALVLEAPPGAGKTTRVPRALLEARLAEDKEIVVLQPRRLATRLAARRVAEEMGEVLGGVVGYQVRFEDVSSDITRLRFVTEGVLGRKLVSDPDLGDIGVVVLDEFHERSVSIDLSLALLQRLQRGSRPDLKLVVMSATLNAAPLSAYLGGCPSVQSSGRLFDVALEYLPAADTRPLELQVLSGLKKLSAGKPDGDVLVFLPGAAEIRRAAEACAEYAGRHGIEIRPLHGDLPPAEQDLAVLPSRNPKLILSTNVAETSITIEGVSAVIDSGQARVASHSPWSGLPALKLAKISQASATQRSGRAGRTRAGRCLRLFTREDFDSRPEHDVPEIRRADLTEAVLALKASGVTDLTSFPFFETPPASSLKASEVLLRRLEAIDGDNRLTPLGRRLLRLPLHPRQARVVAEAEKRGVAKNGALVAAILGERDPRIESRATLQVRERRPRAMASGDSDLLDIVERYRRAEARRFSSGALRELSLEPVSTRAVERAYAQLTRLVSSERSEPASTEDAEQALMMSILAGFPDRVARRRAANSRELLLSGGRSAMLSDTSVVRDSPLLVAVEAEERGPGRGQAVVRLASLVEAEWLLEIAPHELRETDELLWNTGTERVERVRRLTFGDLVLEEGRSPAPPSEAASQVLGGAAMAAGPSRFIDRDALEQWTARVTLLRECFPDAGFPTPGVSLLRSVLDELSVGKQSFDQLEHPALLNSLTGRFTGDQARVWRTLAPERLELPGGRQVKIHYEVGKPPWIESRLQDFFGSTEGPSLCRGRVRVVLHLLAPNQRAVQVTDDLAGFWTRHYPALRRELSRKYPRHAWPEDPARASPPNRSRKG